MTSLITFYSVILLVSFVAMSVTHVHASSQKLCDGLTTPDEVNAIDIGLDVRLEVDYLDNQTHTFKISFIDDKTQSIQPHVDYNFVIRNFTETELTEEIFNAANETGQSTLHTVEGVVTIPARFTGDGYTMAIVSVSGVNFIPVEPPQDATFPCLRVPEFPIGSVGVAAAVIVAAIMVITRYGKTRDLAAFH